MSFTVEVKGINKVVKRIKKLGDEVAEDADKAMGYSARRIERDAKKNVAVDTGDLRASIHMIDKFLEKEVKTDKTHAPFIEFGTVSTENIKIPNGLEKYASKFKSTGGGSFSDLLESIKGWCSRQGIDQEFAYPIALRIAQNGIMARPFLFPAYFKELPKVKKELQKIVDKNRD